MQTCVNYNKFYIGRTNRNFKTRFKDHRTDFMYTKGPQFGDHLILKSYEVEYIEEIMTILHTGNNHSKIQMQELHITRATI